MQVVLPTNGSSDETAQARFQLDLHPPLTHTNAQYTNTSVTTNISLSMASGSLICYLKPLLSAPSNMEDTLNECLTPAWLCDFMPRLLDMVQAVASHYGSRSRRICNSNPRRASPF